MLFTGKTFQEIVLPILRSEGGVGRRPGRSHMEHFHDAEEVKEQSRIIRRRFKKERKFILNFCSFAFNFF